MSSKNYTLQVELEGVFTNVPLYATPLKIERGMEPNADWPGRSGFECEIADDAYDYDPSRPTSLLYGKAGRLAKVRARADSLSYLWAEAQKWAPQRTADHIPGAGRGRSAVVLTAEGLLSRIARWEDPLRSPMYRTISGRPTSIGHWSLEDGRDATRLDNSLATGVGGAVTGAELGDSEAPSGASSSARIAAGSRLAGTFITTSTSAGWQVSWSFHASQAVPDATYVEMFRIRTAHGYTYFFEVRNTGFRMRVVDSDGVELHSTAFNFGSGADPVGEWLTMRLAVEQISGNVSYNWAWYVQDNGPFYFGASTFAGTINRPAYWEQNGQTNTAGWWITHVFGVTGLTDDLMSTTAKMVFNGYKGETARARYDRLMSEAGLTRYSTDDPADTQPMGPQTAKTLLELLKEVRDTDWADLSDERLDIATTWRGRRVLYGQTPALELTHIPAPAGPGDLASWSKVIGTDGIFNRVTVKNAGGGERTVALETGLLSVAAPPDGVGELKRQIDVSVADTGRQLSHLTDWHLARGTVEGPRYESITLDLIASPSLLSAARGVREGDLITVEGLEPDLLRLLVVGIERQCGPGTDQITFRTEPYDVYDVGVWDDAGFRWGTRLSFLSGAHTSGDTTLALTTAKRRGIWSTAFTGDLIIAGEAVHVAPGGMGAASGSGPYTQTATVTRAANGVSKALADGDQVMLLQGKRWGL